MGQVTVRLNGRTYRLRCGDGEEARLGELASLVSKRIDELALRFGQHNDERLLLMAALLMADELLEMKSRSGDAPSDSVALGAASLAPDAGQPDEDASAPSTGAESAAGAAAVGARPASRVAPTPARASLEARLSEARGARSVQRPVTT